MKKFYVYRTTFLPTGQIYVGYHGSDDIASDPYIGSGIVISHLLRKYGTEFFHRQILYTFESELEARKMEESIVNAEFIARKDVLNICLGGQGGSGVAACLSKEQRLLNAKMAAQKLRGRTKQTHQYLKMMGEKTRHRFSQMTEEQRKEHAEKCLSWMNDESKKKCSISKRAQKLTGRNKSNHSGRAIQAEKISGMKNGAARLARDRLKLLHGIPLTQIPKHIFAKKYDLNKQLVAIEQLITSGIAQGEAAKLSEMPVSSFNALIAKIVQWAEFHVNSLLVDEEKSYAAASRTTNAIASRTLRTS